ncbi:hypothetical protein BJ138DRAFT_1162046 [Hygrophoropsis aurantiaca]|uniref:Uncharacterized protein n=1 Tax=Hygrophoropsis aurantiaca TaxID=72124 RepID=A0ACB8A1V6_9AGAM|nr:hypothetical protein BJ138DRAFT_1162046 [Hygrophoropsis aurantiaca]
MNHIPFETPIKPDTKLGGYTMDITFAHALALKLGIEVREPKDHDDAGYYSAFENDFNGWLFDGGLLAFKAAVIWPPDAGISTVSLFLISSFVKFPPDGDRGLPLVEGEHDADNALRKWLEETCKVPKTEFHWGTMVDNNLITLGGVQPKKSCRKFGKTLSQEETLSWLKKKAEKTWQSKLNYARRQRVTELDTHSLSGEIDEHSPSDKNANLFALSLSQQCSASQEPPRRYLY